MSWSFWLILAGIVVAVCAIAGGRANRRELQKNFFGQMEGVMEELDDHYQAWVIFGFAGIISVVVGISIAVF